MIETTLPSGRATLVDTVFRRLFENEFATLDGIAISHRTDRQVEFIDETTALGRMLDIDTAFAPAEPSDPTVASLHQAIYAALPEHDAVVSGWSRHLRALLAEDMALPACTSMMRKRGVSDLAPHVIKRSALDGPAFAATLAAARARAERNEATHILIVADDGYVTVAAATLIGAMANWHNVEFAARIECMRVEEADLHVG